MAAPRGRGRGRFLRSLTQGDQQVLGTRNGTAADVPAQSVEVPDPEQFSPLTEASCKELPDPEQFSLLNAASHEELPDPEQFSSLNTASCTDPHASSTQDESGLSAMNTSSDDTRMFIMLNICSPWL